MNSSENSLKSFFDEQTELGANGQSAASRFVRWLISSLAFPFLTDEKHVNLARKIPAESATRLASHPKRRRQRPRPHRFGANFANELTRH